MFRNREIKEAAAVIAAVSVCGVAAGFFISGYAAALAAALCALLAGVFFAFTYQRYKRIDDLSGRLDILLHKGGIFEKDMLAEGELSVLSSQVQKMTRRLVENADALKSDKLYLSDAMADIAHQLKTPLTSMGMLLTFLKEEGLPFRRRARLARELEGLVLRIDWLITAMLKIAKIEAGTAAFRADRVGVGEMLEKAAQPLMAPLEIREVGLSIKGDRDAAFVGDLNWTAEAIGNILKNCMEHTPPGGEIKVGYLQNPLFTEITISDNGCGIDKDDLPYIFERFYHGKGAGEGSFGIGLALSRMIINSQNGTVKAQNIQPHGACFTVRFYSSAN